MGTRTATAAALALCMLPLSARAQSTPDQGVVEASEADKAKARGHYMKGLAAIEAEDWHAARDALLEAWTLTQQYQIAGNLGLSELQLRQFKEAAEHLTYYVEHLPANSTAAKRSEAEAQLQRALKQVGRLRVRLVLMGQDYSGGELAIDGKPLGKNARRSAIFLDPGRHVIEARERFLSGDVQEVEVKPGSTHEVEIRMFFDDPEARAKAAAVLPVKPASAPAVDAATGSRGEPSWPLWPAFIGGGMMLGGVVLGTVAVARSNSEADTAEAFSESCGPENHAACDAAAGPRDAKYAWANVAIISYGAAGMVLIGTAGYLAFRDALAPRVRSASPRLTPLVGVTGLGVGVEGAF